MRTQKSKITGKEKEIIFASIVATIIVAIVVLNFSTGPKHVRSEIEHLYSTHDTQFLRTMGVVLGPALVGGNKVEVLLNGDAIFASMLEAIREAKKTIAFETYIYWGETIGHEFAAALAERAQAGVTVHLLVDWLGSDKMDGGDIAKMKNAGVEVEKYNPLAWYSISRVNNRTHRKLLIVDGRIGFTSGVGISDKWRGNALDPDHWRDTHFRVEGPVVAQMQSAFMDNWIKVTGKVLHSEQYFPALDSCGTIRAQIFSSAPAGGNESMELMYLLAITAAEHSIELSSAYFVPDDLSIKSLVSALKRGVKVQIITPGSNIDNASVRGASRSRWGDLLKAGAEMYEYQPTMYHCKVMIVDDIFTTVGSTNFDPRSFGLNAEANLNIYDADFAKAQVNIFRDDLARSKRLTYAQWQDRPLWEKFLDQLASFVGSAL
jgi:cardiolipin synthase